MLVPSEPLIGAQLKEEVDIGNCRRICEHERRYCSAGCSHMTRKLLLMTSNFPYGFGESFITAELPYLARAFEDVVVLPWNTAVGPRREMPANVRLEHPVRHGSRVRFYLIALLHRKAWRLFFRETPRQIRLEGFSFALVARMVMLACIRVALELDPVVRRAAATPGETVAYAYWGMPAGYAIPFLAESGVPCCTRFHGFDLYNRGYCLPWRDEVAASSRVVAFISDQGKRYFEEHVAHPAHVHSPLCVCRLGVEDEGTNPAAQDDSKLIVVSCSFISPLKRVHLIAGLAKALSRYRPVEWHHFGGGEDADLLAELAESVETLSVHMHGTVPNSELIEFYREHHVDLFVNLSTSEGIPVSIMEAISFGIPVVATEVGGTAEIVIEGLSGLLIPSRDATDSEALARRILREMREGGAIARSNPREVWADRYNAARNFSTFAAQLRSLGGASAAADAPQS